MRMVSGSSTRASASAALDTRRMPTILNVLVSVLFCYFFFSKNGAAPKTESQARGQSINKLGHFNPFKTGETERVKGGKEVGVAPTRLGFILPVLLCILLYQSFLCNKCASPFLLVFGGTIKTSSSKHRGSNVFCSVNKRWNYQSNTFGMFLDVS